MINKANVLFKTKKWILISYTKNRLNQDSLGIATFVKIFLVTKMRIQMLLLYTFKTLESHFTKTTLINNFY
ncbi:hypothetical protein WA1_42365 [Scytonema hofmannii PCC 7110]|uniref:Uncharacterized protein n=1 Tax=Scytonema hofmannii PCC 7110 TaxID=128403 RepID=A0A139WVA1_9CYAN|nr:hypothetical protein WA1_42365 [Scytonema hofmannii PCC 7110]